MTPDPNQYVLAIDPGLTSGLAFVDMRDATVLESAELDWWDLGMRTGEILTAHIGQVTVVIERFIITTQTAKNSQAPFSLEAIGQTRWIAARCNAGEPKKQSPTDAKNFATNPKLKRLGMWHVGGAGHANDALRHALLYMVRNGFQDQRLLG